MENQNLETGKNYIKNSTTSKGRAIRLEVVGEVSQAERNFLNGIIHFTSGIISRNSESFLTQVSGIMIRLIKYLLKRSVPVKNTPKDKGGTI